MRRLGERIVRIVSALITAGMAGCIALFAVEGRLTEPTIASYAVAVVACGTFATAWPWRGNSRARFYSLIGVLWGAAAAGAWFGRETMTATLYGVAAALSFWVALITVSQRGERHTHPAAQPK